MIEPKYEDILKEKIDYYGETKAAYQFAAKEYARKNFEYKISCNPNVKITFGLQQWHIDRIESERKRWNNINTNNDEKVDMIYSTHFWEILGKEFAWHSFTLALYYFEYLQEKMDA